MTALELQAAGVALRVADDGQPFAKAGGALRAQLRDAVAARLACIHAPDEDPAVPGRCPRCRDVVGGDVAAGQPCWLCRVVAKRRADRVAAEAGGEPLRAALAVFDATDPGTAASAAAHAAVARAWATSERLLEALYYLDIDAYVEAIDAVDDDRVGDAAARLAAARRRSPAPPAPVALRHKLRGRWVW